MSSRLTLLKPTPLTRIPLTRNSAPRLTQLSLQLKSPASSNSIRTMASATIPKTMTGIMFEKNGGVEVLQLRKDLPVPVPKAGEVLIKIDFIGVNFIDTYFRTGLYPAPFPQIPGREVEGTVVATASSGDLYGFKAGDHVVMMPGGGGYAEYTTCDAKAVHLIPEGMKPGVAAASMIQGLTAITLIRESYFVQKGDWILVHAAAGGVGLWLCQLLKAVGARTIGTASTEAKIALAKENGAEFMINYSHEDVVTKVKEITGGVGVAAVFDGVGKSTFEWSLEALARKGTLASFGNASGAVPPFAISRLSAKNAKVCRPTLFNYLVTREERERYTKELFDIIMKDKLNVRIHEVYPLADAGRAQTDLEGRKTTGKLLLKP